MFSVAMGLSVCILGTALAYEIGHVKGKANCRGFMVKGRDGRVSHVVLYKTFAKNPNAADEIVRQAYVWLAGIPGLLSFHAARIAPSTRSVTDSCYNVMLNMVFESEAARNAFMEHPNHQIWVDWVLVGWQLEGDSNPTHQTRFANFKRAIMEGKPGKPVVPRRDPAVLDEFVVWRSEQVFDTVSENWRPK